MFSRGWRAAALFALAFTVVLGALPLAVAGSASFLGKDVTSIAAGVVGFYPGIAVMETVRVLALALVVGFVGSLPFALTAGDLRRARPLIFPVLPMVAYLLWLSGAMLEYPALYEATLSQRLQTLLLRLSFYAAPSHFYVTGAALFAVPLVLGLCRRRPGQRAKTPAATVAACVALATLTVPVAALWLSLGHSSARAGTDGDRPHVLLIAVDSLRADKALDATLMPTLAALAADPGAVSFVDHYVGIPRTFPSWVEMLEGRYAAKTGIRHMFPGFGQRSGELPGLATTLRDAGYATSVHSDFAGDIFPRFAAGFERVNAPKLTLMTMIRLSIDQMFPAFLPMMTTGPARPLFPALKQSPAFADPVHLGDELLAEISAIQARAPSQPWLAAAFFSTAHFPYAAPYPYYRLKAASGYAGPFRFQKNPEMGAGDASLGAADVAQVRALYDGALRAVDDELGRVFARLKRDGLWDRTLIVVTADHGEDLYENGNLQGHGEHLRGEHVLKVPFMLKLPAGTVPSVQRVATTTRSIDLASTIGALCKVPTPIGDGVDLSPLMLASPSSSSPTTALAAYAETGIWFARSGDGFFQGKRLDYPGISGLLSFDQGYSGEIVLNAVYEKTVVTAKHRMLIDGDLKIIYMPTSRGVEYELYDRRRDPDNLQDLASTEPVRLAAMKDRLLAFIRENEGPDAAVADEFVVPP